MAILNDTTVAPIYLVPAIAGTINQLAPGVLQHVPVPDTVQSHHQPDSCIQQLTDYCEDEKATSDSFCDYVSTPKEPPCIRSFRQGGGRTLFGRFDGSRGSNQQNRHTARPQASNYGKNFKGTCNSLGMAGHHADSCHFLIEL